jgi:hypothetical protein
MRRGIYCGAFLLVLSGITLSAPLAASASIAAAQKHSHTVRCTSAAIGHKKVTKTVVTACSSSSLKVTHPCPTGSSTIFVIVHDRTYALRVGHSPKRLPTQYGMGTITQVCGNPVTVLTTSTTLALAPAPTTTATAAPPPPTTAPVPPPPTTAAPASCHPLTDGGNCYEPGEYCRDSDHGVSGVAGDGEAITCANTNGWRWEPS